MTERLVLWRCGDRCFGRGWVPKQERPPLALEVGWELEWNLESSRQRSWCMHMGGLEPHEKLSPAGSGPASLQPRSLWLSFQATYIPVRPPLPGWGEARERWAGRSLESGSIIPTWKVAVSRAGWRVRTEPGNREGGPPGLPGFSAGLRRRQWAEDLSSRCPAEPTSISQVKLLGQATGTRPEDAPFPWDLWGGLASYVPVCAQTIFSCCFILATASKIISAKTYAMTLEGELCSEMLLKFS